MDQLETTLWSILSPDQSQRENAESLLQLNYLQIGFPTALLNLILDETNRSPLAIRQIAAVVLKQQQQQYYNNMNNNTEGIQQQQQQQSSLSYEEENSRRNIENQALKNQILNGIILMSHDHNDNNNNNNMNNNMNDNNNNNNSKIRTALCNIIVTIFEIQGLEKWPELLIFLMNGIYSTGSLDSLGSTTATTIIHNEKELYSVLKCISMIAEQKRSSRKNNNNNNGGGMGIGINNNNNNNNNNSNNNFYSSDCYNEFAPILFEKLGVQLMEIFRATSDNNHTNNNNNNNNNNDNNISSYFQYSIQIRILCARNIRALIKALVVLKASKVKYQKTKLRQFIPIWCQACIYTLEDEFEKNFNRNNHHHHHHYHHHHHQDSNNNNNNNNDHSLNTFKNFELSMEILSGLNMISLNFAHDCIDSMNALLTVVWKLFVNGFPIYERICLSYNNDNDNSMVLGGYDSDGNRLDFDVLIIQIIEFLITMANSNIETISQLMVNGILDLFYNLLGYMQVTYEEMILLEDDPEEFIENDDEDGIVFSVRHSARQLINEFTENFPMESIKAVIQVVEQRFHECCQQEQLQEEQQQQSNSNSNKIWRMKEACLVMLGSLENAIMEEYEYDDEDDEDDQNDDDDDHDNNNNKVILEKFKAILLLAITDSNNSQCQLLQGRGLWLASRYVIFLPIENQTSIAQGCVLALDDRLSLPLRICGCRALAYLYPNIDENHQMSLFIPGIEKVCNLSQSVSENILHLVIETLVVFVSKCSHMVSSEIVNGLVNISINIWSKYPTDQLIVGIIEQLLLNLGDVANEAIRYCLIICVFPQLKTILNEASENGAPHALVVASFGVLTKYISKINCNNFDLSILQDMFFVLMKCIIIRADEYDIMKDSAKCLTSFVITCKQNLFEWKNDTGINGVNLILQFISQVFNSDDKKAKQASSALVAVIIMNLSDQLDQTVVYELLSSIITSLYSSESELLVQQYVLVFVRLFYVNTGAVISFLKNFPSPDHMQSTLEYFLDRWVEVHEKLHGLNSKKLSCAAMLNLVSFSFENDISIQQIALKAPKELRLEKVRTRYSFGPCILSAVIQVLIDIRQKENQDISQGENDDDYDSGYDIDDDADGKGSIEQYQLSDILENEDFFAFENPALYEDDEDLKFMDEINIEVLFGTFLNHVKQTNTSRIQIITDQWLQALPQTQRQYIEFIVAT